MKKLMLLGLILSVLFLTNSAWAVKGTVGLGVGVTPDYEGSDDSTGIPMFMFDHRYDSGRFVNLMGPKLKVGILASEQFNLGPVVNYRFGRDDVDNNRIDAMKDIDDSVELGLFTSMKFDNLTLGLEFLADVSGKVDSKLLKGTIDYRFKPSDTLTITPGLFTTFAGEEYLDTFFGVDQADADRSGLPTYGGFDNEFKDVGANLVVHSTPWQNWGIMGIASVSTLLGDAKDSPIVDDEGDATQWFAGVMATYRWGK